MIVKKNLDDNNLEGLPSVGPSTKSKLNLIGINRISDLILFLPSFLIDKTKLTKINEIENSASCLFIGEISKAYKTKGFKPNLILNVIVEDANIQIRFLHKIMIYKNLKPGLKIRFSGIMRIKGKTFEMIHPDVEILTGKSDVETVVPYYKTRKIISQNKIRKLIKYVYKYISNKNNTDIFSSQVLKKLHLPQYLEALKHCHFPLSSDYDTSKAKFNIGRQRFIIEELLAYKLVLIDAKKKHELNHSPKFLINNNTVDQFIGTLPFKLTSSQVKAIEDIKKNFQHSYPTKRLIQGDVGSGKTIIAAIASLYATLSGLQVAILVPTEILADQHFETFKTLFSNMPIRIECLKSTKRDKDKKIILNDITDGLIDIIIGTHSLIEKKVNFKNLGLVIVDEQHKFGVNQRIQILSNNIKDIYPHELYLSATPIPRSLSLVLYEGLDYTVIDQMPQGRKTILTKVLNKTQRHDLYNHISNILLCKEQIYWVCSCIDFTESLEVEYAANMVSKLSDRFPSHSIGIIHGRMDTRDNKKTMEQFISGDIDILVCTTMIEVGVDVPNTTCIVIEDSNRFGLSQLHQLRGRVGRSNKQSYCYLLHNDEINDIAKDRLNSLVKHSNGFNIAEEDLRLRGEGDYLGIKQSGSHQNFKLATPDDAIQNYDKVKNTLDIIDGLSLEDRKKLIKRWDKSLSDTIEL